MEENSMAAYWTKRGGEDEESIKISENDDHGWKTVSYHKKSRKLPARKGVEDVPDHRSVGSPDVFRSIELHSEERRRRLEAQRAVVSAAVGEYSTATDDEEDGSVLKADGGRVENGEAGVKKSKPKKPKKPKVTISEAAAKIDASHLASFLLDITDSYELQQEIQLMRFADYFGRAFASVSVSQFPWMKTLKESSVAKMVDIPLSHIPEAVYQTSVDWLNLRSHEPLSSFTLWLLDSILCEFTLQQGAGKGLKRAVKQTPSKSQAGIFVVLAMVLRCKPDVLINISTTLKEKAKYQGQDKIPIMIWMFTQASQGHLITGLFMWVHFFLPILSGKSTCNPQSRDLILQMVERITSFPKARAILVNGAVRKGERLVPPSALELLMRATFPAPSARIKATERFEAIYPILKDVALALAPGSRVMKQVTMQIMHFAVKAAGEGIPDLSREACSLFVWCLAQNTDCYKQWDNIYMENLEASVVFLREMSDELKVKSRKHPNLDHLKATLKSFKVKSEKALASADDDIHEASLLKDAQTLCKLMLGRLSRTRRCIKSTMVVTVALAVGAAFMAIDSKSFNIQKLLVDFNLP